MPSLFLCQVSPKLLDRAGDPNKGQTSKQAQEPLILSLWQSLSDKKLMALVLACIR